MSGLKFNKYEYCHPLEVAGRGSETQLQVDVNLNCLIKRINPLTAGTYYIRFLHFL